MGNLYENISALCDERGIKGGRMCTDLGISKGLLTDLKMGRRSGVSAKTADKIASYFGVSVGYLLGTETEKAPAEEGGRISDGEIKAAFFRGADPTITEEEMDAMWEDAKSYMQYKLSQRSNQKKNDR